MMNKMVWRKVTWAEVVFVKTMNGGNNLVFDGASLLFNGESLSWS
jgi:hypothetical protein